MFQPNWYPTTSNKLDNIVPTEVIDWETVSSIDPELIKKTGDLTILKPFLSKFVGTNLTMYDSLILSHPLAVRLCCILQISLQYMSDVQQQLQSQVEEKEKEITKVTLIAKKYKQAYQKADLILKKRMKPFEKCPICLKKFENFDFLDNHIKRRHPEHQDEWLSIRNKRPGLKLNSYNGESSHENVDIQALITKITELQNTIRKDRQTNQNKVTKNLQKKLIKKQEELMKTEDLESAKSISRRENMNNLLNTAVEELNSSWIEYHKHKSPKGKANKNNEIFKQNKNLIQIKDSEFKEIPIIERIEENQETSDESFHFVSYDNSQKFDDETKSKTSDNKYIQKYSSLNYTKTINEEANLIPTHTESISSQRNEAKTEQNNNEKMSILIEGDSSLKININNTNQSAEEEINETQNIEEQTNKNTEEKTNENECTEEEINEDESTEEETSENESIEEEEEEEETSESKSQISSNTKEEKTKLKSFQHNPSNQENSYANSILVPKSINKSETDNPKTKETMKLLKHAKKFIQSINQNEHNFSSTIINDKMKLIRNLVQQKAKEFNQNINLDKVKHIQMNEFNGNAKEYQSMYNKVRKQINSNNETIKYQIDTISPILRNVKIPFVSDEISINTKIESDNSNKTSDSDTFYSPNEENNEKLSKESKISYISSKEEKHNKNKEENENDFYEIEKEFKKSKINIPKEQSTDYIFMIESSPTFAGVNNIGFRKPSENTYRRSKLKKKRNAQNTFADSGLLIVEEFEEFNRGTSSEAQDSCRIEECK